MNKNIVKGTSLIPKSQNQISHLPQQSTSLYSKPSKGSNRSNASSQEKTDLSPQTKNAKLSSKDSKEPKATFSEGKQPIKIDLSQSSQTSQIDFSKLNSKAYIKIINRLFKYLKKILSHEVYTDIKKHFCEEAHKYVNKMSYCLFRNDESQSSIFNYLKYDEMNIKNGQEKVLKLSCDFSQSSGKEKPVQIEGKIMSNNSNNNNNDVTDSIKAEVEGDEKNETNNTNTITNIITNDNTNYLVASYENPQNTNNSTNNQKQSKQSLYYLTKGRVNTPTIMKNAKKSSTVSNPNANCFNRSKTQSNSKSSSRECFHNTNNMFGKAKQIIMGGNSNSKDKHLPNSYSNVYSKEVINIHLAKDNNNYNNNNNIKPHHLLNGKMLLKIDSEMNKSSNNNNIIHNKEKSIETIDLTSNRQHLTQFQIKTKKPMIKSTEIIKRPNDLNSNNVPNYKSLNKSSGPIMINNSKSKEKEKEKVIKTQYIDLAKSDEGQQNSQPKNEEMMKVIKLSLDDNLKYMFNFSYENFLSKESESQSKQSQDLNEPSS